MALTRSTPERRAGVFQLKLMFDEAHRLREEINIASYANQVADIELALARLDPSYADMMSRMEDSAADLRLKGKVPDSSGSEWIKKNFAYLDHQLRFIKCRFSCFESQLRLGFETETTIPPDMAGSVDYI